MANAITVGRLIMLFVVIAAIYYGNVTVIGICAILIAIVIALDGLDGYVARKQGSTSQFGAVFDIAGDRIVENCLWVVFAELQLIPVWVPLLVITRGFIVDGLRSMHLAEGMTPFGEKNMMRSDFTRWLTAGRFMRSLYGYAKAFGFVFLTGMVAYRHHDTTDTFLGALYDVDFFRFLGWVCVWSAVALTIIRGLPVIVDALRAASATPQEPPPAPSSAGATTPATRA